MKLQDTGYTAQQIRDLASKYMIETYERFDLLAETAKISTSTMRKGLPTLIFMQVSQ